MTLTADQAIDLLRQRPAQYATPSQLRTLATQVEADSPGRLTVLYSGPAASGLSGNDVIQSMIASGEDIRAINKSQAAKFLESEDFQYAVAKAHGLPDARALRDSAHDSPAKAWLYHPTQGPWADVSARFADATVGEVRAIVPDALPSRTFREVELPRILANPNVTVIEGMPREALVDRQSAQGTQAVFEAITARSREHVSELRISVNHPVNHAGKLLPDDTGGWKLDSRVYFEGTSIQGKTPAFTDPTRSLGGSMNPPTQYAVAGQQHLQTWQAELTQSRHPPTAPLSGAAKVTMGLGSAAAAYDAATTGQDIKRSLDQNNIVGAQSHLIRFGARELGAWAGGVAGFQAGANSPIPHPIVRGAAAVGGAVVGVAAGEKVAELVDDYHVYNQDGSDGHRYQYDPNHPEKGWRRFEQTNEIDHSGMPDEMSGQLPYKTQWHPASAEMSSELDYKATTESVQLNLSGPARPQDPYVQGNWERLPRNGQWQLQTLEGMNEAGPIYSSRYATPQETTELNKMAIGTIQQNIAHSPEAMAARYELAYHQNGWSQHGPIPAAVTHARKPASEVMASDGNHYQRHDNGSWVSKGIIYDSEASRNIHDELESTMVHRVGILQPMHMAVSMAKSSSPQAETEPPRAIKQSESSPVPSQGSTAPAELSNPQSSLDDPRDPKHPDHKMYCQIQDGVHKLDAAHGRTPDESSDRLTASLLAQAKQAGLTRVDHVVFNPASKDHDGNDIPANKYAFAVEGDMGALDMKRAALPTAEAVATSEQDSFQKLADINRSLDRQQEQERQLAQQKDQDDPTKSGPKMG